MMEPHDHAVTLHYKTVQSSSTDNDADLLIVDKIKSISSVTSHVTCDDTARRCSNDVLQDTMQSSSPQTSSRTGVSTEQHGLMDGPMKEGEKRSEPNVKPVDTTSDLSLNSNEICRICHDGSSKETFISPCQCRGSLSFVHQSCLERWLGASNRNNCEICEQEFHTEYKCQPFINWLCNPTHWLDWYDLIIDIICCLIPTPLVLYHVFLFITGAIQCFSRTIGLNWRSIGLGDVMVSFFFITAYLFYCIVVWRHHLRVFRDWQKFNQIVKIINFQTQPTPFVVTLGDLRTSLSNSRINIHDSADNQPRPRPPTIGHNQVQPWSCRELDDGNTYVSDPLVNILTPEIRWD